MDRGLDFSPRLHLFCMTIGAIIFGVVWVQGRDGLGWGVNAPSRGGVRHRLDASAFLVLIELGTAHLTAKVAWSKGTAVSETTSWWVNICWLWDEFSSTPNRSGGGDWLCWTAPKLHVCCSWAHRGFCLEAHWELSTLQAHVFPGGVSRVSRQIGSRTMFCVPLLSGGWGCTDSLFRSIKAVVC